MAAGAGRPGSQCGSSGAGGGDACRGGAEDAGEEGGLVERLPLEPAQGAALPSSALRAAIK